jgi:hypothetical protein
LYIDAPSIDSLPPFVLDVYDFDKNTLLKDSKDYLGRAVIETSECSKTYIVDEKTIEDDGPPEPKWHPFRFN